MSKYYSTVAIALVVASMAGYLISSESVKGKREVEGEEHRELSGVIQMSPVEEIKHSRLVQEIKTLPPAYQKPMIPVKPFATPMQTFYIPLEEEALYDSVLFPVNKVYNRGPIDSRVSISISTDKTVVWWDHWEDGYDAEAANSGRTTLVWGDGNATNGCAPRVSPCTNANDFLMAGRSIVVQSTVVVPRNKTSFQFDGADRVQASMPITVTRAANPRNPGPHISSSVEVFDTSFWGYVYEAPVGENLHTVPDSFKGSQMHLMASENDTFVTLSNGTIMTIHQGKGIVVKVDLADKFESNKPIQAHLLTINDVRWFTLRHNGDGPGGLSNSYVSPVGDTRGMTKLIIYNPDVKPLTVKFQYLLNGTKTEYSRVVASKKSTLSRVVPTGSGVLVDGDQNFVALSYTDTEVFYGPGGKVIETWGGTNNWGFALIPRDELSSLVLVGYGKSCADVCVDGLDRNVVWVSPVQDADIYVDFQNTGVNQTKVSANALQSIQIVDKDKDMTGAVIFAVKKGGPKDGNRVNIAVSWGPFSLTVDEKAWSPLMKQGHAIQPTPPVAIAKIFDEAVAVPGNGLLCTIRIANTVENKLVSDVVVLKDTLDSDFLYLPNSAAYTSVFDLKTVPIPDSTSGTAFPLDEAGFAIPAALFKRGRAIDITYRVFLASDTEKTKIVTSGVLSQSRFSDLSFAATTVVEHNANIRIDNAVSRGAGDESSCYANTHEHLDDYLGMDVTFCFAVRNTGRSHLSDIVVSNAALKYQNELTGLILAPGETWMVATQQKIAGNVVNSAVVVAKPVFASGSPIPYADVVTSSDASSVGLIQVKAAINVTNFFYQNYAGVWDEGAHCNFIPWLSKYAAAALHIPMTYCFNVTNTGDTFLGSVHVYNQDVNFSQTVGGLLAPKETRTLFAQSLFLGGVFDNNVVATGVPVSSSGKKIEGLNSVVSSDNSRLDELYSPPKVAITTSVYLGNDGGKLCGTNMTFPSLLGFSNDNVTYCFEVTNPDHVPINNIKVSVPQLNVVRSSPTPLRIFLKPWTFHVDSKISGPSKVDASVTANGCDFNGTLIPRYPVASATSNSALVDVLKNEAAMAVENTVYIGHDQGTSCATSGGANYVEGKSGEAVTFCYKYRNVGNAHLSSFEVVDASLAFNATSAIAIAPGATGYLFLEKNLGTDGKLTSLATVGATPVLPTGASMAGIQQVVGSGTASAAVNNLPPAAPAPPTPTSLAITNKVVLASSNDASQCSNASDRVEGEWGTRVLYCFNITNFGKTDITNVKMYSKEIWNVETVAIQKLSVGQSLLITLPGMIEGPLTNTMVVVGSGWTNAYASSTVDFAKPATGLNATAENCIEDQWKKSGESSTLVCAAKEVFLTSLIAKKPMACKKGTPFVVSLDGTIRMEASAGGAAARRDLGWYVAADLQGDALAGQCVVSGLRKSDSNKYRVVSTKFNATSIGSVAWSTADGGDNDQCGDVVLKTLSSNATSLQMNSVPILVNSTVTCDDHNDNGLLEIAVCFTWRNNSNNNNNMCAISTNVPAGATGGCYCAKYQVPNVQVTATGQLPYEVC